MTKQVFKGLRSQCATNWQPFLLTKHALFHRIAMQMFCLVFQKKSSGFLKLTKDILILIKPMRFVMMLIFRHKAHQRKGPHHVASVFSRMTQCSMTLPFCCCFLIIFRLIKKKIHILHKSRIPNFSTQ